MTIHTHKLPTFALYTAYADEFGLTAFGSCREEALNNLVDQVRDRQAVPTPAGKGRGLVTKESRGGKTDVQ